MRGFLRDKEARPWGAMCLSGRSLLEEVYDYDFFLTNIGMMLVISSASPVAGPVLHPPPPPPPSEGGGVGVGVGVTVIL